MKMRLRFRECEHDGDAHMYEEAIKSVGGTITNIDREYAQEECVIEFEYDDDDDIIMLLDDTDAEGMFEIA